MGRCPTQNHIRLQGGDLRVAAGDSHRPAGARRRNAPEHRAKRIFWQRTADRPSCETPAATGPAIAYRIQYDLDWRNGQTNCQQHRQRSATYLPGRHCASASLRRTRTSRCLCNGRAYGARTTPQMVLINPNGRIDYHGAIDSIRSANPADIANAINYVKQAIEETLAGKPVSVKSATPYGCSVKY